MGAVKMLPRILISDSEQAARRIQNALEKGELALTQATKAGVQSKLNALHPGFVFCPISNGSAALECVYSVLDCKVVAVPDVTFWSTATAAHRVGCAVVLAPTNEHGALDLEWLERQGPYTFDTVVFVPLGGIYSPEYGDKLYKICREKGWKLVYDAAQCVGLPMGKADAMTLSFYSTKVVTCGEGGAVGFADPGDLNVAEAWLNHGKDSNPQSPDYYGCNARLTELQGIVLDVQLENIESILTARRQKASMYDACSDMITRSAIWYGTGMTGAYLFNGYKVICRVPGVAGVDVEKKMAERGYPIDTPVYRVPLHRMPVLVSQTTLVYGDEDYAKTEIWCREHFALPCWQAYDEDKIPALMETLNAVLQELSP